MAKKLFKTFKTADADRLKNVVREFNKKVTRTSKTISGQPDKIKYSEITRNITSRAEFNRVLNVYSRYLKPGQEKTYKNASGTTITRWLRDETRYALTRINNAREKKRLEYESLKGGIRKAAYDELNLEPRKNLLNTITKRSYANKYFETIQNQANREYYKIGESNYKKNYLKSLRTQYRGIPGFNALYNLIKELSGDTLLKAAAQDPTFLVEFNYGFEEAELKVEYLNEKWEEYLTENNITEYSNENI